MCLVDSGQVDDVRAERPRPAIPIETPRAGNETVVVTSAALDVYDQPHATAYLIGQLKPGDRIQVRARVAGGWLAIEPHGSAICWIDGSALDLGSDADRTGSHFRDPAGPSAVIPTRAWVIKSQADVRSGHSSARLPGPPCGSINKGTMVQLVDRPPIKAGRGKTTTTWYAIVPPAGVLHYVRADGTHSVNPAPDGAAERLAAFDPSKDGPSNSKKLQPAAAEPAVRAQNASENLPADIASELANVEAIHRAILADQPIEQWQFETVRARYQAILKRAGANPPVEEAVRDRLARVTQHEQAAKAARTIEEILARSHRRDGALAAAERRRSSPARLRAGAFSAEGLVKPSARMVDGRKLYSLVGPDGHLVAYLDVPPGLDIEPLVTRRVGVRGASHYNEDLGARLITVRDVDPLEVRR